MIEVVKRFKLRDAFRYRGVQKEVHSEFRGRKP
jgi:hypothetical protein